MPNTVTTIDPSTVVSFLVAVFLPLAISWAQDSRASSQFKAIFAFAACALVALLATILTKQFVGQWSDDVGQNIWLVTLNVVTVLMTSWNLYARLYNPTGVAGKLEKTGPKLGAPKTK